MGTLHEIYDGVFCGFEIWLNFVQINVVPYAHNILHWPVLWLPYNHPHQSVVWTGSHFLHNDDTLHSVAFPGGINEPSFMSLKSDLSLPCNILCNGGRVTTRRCCIALQRSVICNPPRTYFISIICIWLIFWNAYPANTECSGGVW